MVTQKAFHKDADTTPAFSELNYCCLFYEKSVRLFFPLEHTVNWREYFLHFLMLRAYYFTNYYYNRILIQSGKGLDLEYFL